MMSCKQLFRRRLIAGVIGLVAAVVELVFLVRWCFSPTKDALDIAMMGFVLITTATWAVWDLLVASDEWAFDRPRKLQEEALRL